MEELEKILWIGTMALEIVLLGIVSLRGAARNVPTFLVYLYWCALGDIAVGFCYYRVPGNTYVLLNGIQSATEGILLLAVLFDLARSLVRPLPLMVSRGVIRLFGLVTIGAGAIVWRVSDSWALLSNDAGWHFLLREQLTSALLRVLLLLILGGLIQFFSRHFLLIGWGERELQIATGMGIYALASLAESLATTYQSSLTRAAFVRIYVSVGIIYIVCLLYWIVCFSRDARHTATQFIEDAETASDSANSTLWQNRRAEFSTDMAGEP